MITSLRTSNPTSDDCPRGITVHSGLEIKTPSNKALLRTKIYPNKGVHATCEFGDNTFHRLVYKPEYRTQVLHEAACCNLEYVLFVVADETDLIYSTLIHFPSYKRWNYIGILEGVYNRTLTWAYTDAWDSNDPMEFMPEFRQQMVSAPSYPVDRESLCFEFFIWKIIRETKLSCLCL